MTSTNLKILLLILLFCIPLAACNYPGTAFTPPTVESTLPAGEIIAQTTPVPVAPETLINFLVEVPAETDIEDTVYINILDEVTGLALNVQSFPMELSPPPESGQTIGALYYSISLPFAIGAVVKYRYTHMSDQIQLAEHTSEGSPVRYRLYHVQGPGGVHDVVSRWTDTTFNASTGRIMGQAIDSQTSLPIPNLLVTAGGAQTLTRANGNFLLEGLPPGVHNLVAYSLDGAYSIFQQGARVEALSTTPAELTLSPVRFVNVLFVVSVPDNTPPGVPLRVAGNLYSMGNTFANLTGDVNGMVLNMPGMQTLPDGRYMLTMPLPVGADIRYKYTLGDGLWNAEHQENGDFKLRQIIVPDHEGLVEDSVETWYDGTPNALTFDVNVPDNTPTDDFVSIQFGPIIGWTEPIPMWRLGENRWAYMLFSPLNLPGNFSYRYCRNNQCGYADDALTPGRYGAGREVKIGPEPQLFTDQVLEWVSLYAETSAFEIPDAAVTQRGQDYWAGLELIPAYHPSWRALFPAALDDIANRGANKVVLSPTWTFGHNPPGNAPPVLAPLPGSDIFWPDLLEAVQEAQALDLSVVLFPKAKTLLPIDEWWLTAPRDDAFWTVWFDQYRALALHHASLASQSGVSALILGGDGVAPAYPNGLLPDGSPAETPVDTENRWRNLIADVRSVYDGQLLWALSESEIRHPPEFLDATDGAYLLWAPTQPNQIDTLSDEFNYWLDYNLWPFQILLGKPIVLGLSYPSDPSMSTQYEAYITLLTATSEREWINGVISRGYYPPAALQDQLPSVHGKPTSALLGYWFPRLLGGE